MPVSVPLQNQVRWTETHCNQSNRGSERDWLGFFYTVNSGSNASTMTNVEDVYEHLCGGTRQDSDTAKWNDLASSAVAVLSGDKELKFLSDADDYGINH